MSDYRNPFFNQGLGALGQAQAGSLANYHRERIEAESLSQRFELEYQMKKRSKNNPTQKTNLLLLLEE